MFNRAIRNGLPGFAAVVAVLAALAASAPAQDLAQGGARLVAAVPRAATPEYLTGGDMVPTGFAVEAMREIARLAESEVEFKVAENWAAVLEMVRSGQADLIPLIGVTDERAAEFLFTAPLSTVPISVFVRKGVRWDEHRLSLAGRNVGAGEAGAAVPLLYQAGDVHVTVYPDVSSALFALLSGTVEALAYPEDVLLGVARRFGLEAQLNKVGPPLAELRRAVAVRRTDVALHDRLDSAVRRFVRGKAYRDLYANWFGTAEPFWTPLRVGAAFGGLLFLTIMAMGTWHILSVVRLNRRLGESEKRYREIVETTTQGVSVIDIEGRIEFVNRRMAEMLGYTPEEMIGRVAFDFMDESSRERGWREFARRRAGEASEYDTIYVRKDGTRLAGRLSSNPRFDERGAVIGGTALITDITERKRAEEERRLLAAVVETSKDAIWSRAVDGTVTSWNRSAEEMFGIPASEIVGRHMSAIWPEELRERMAALRARVDSGEALPGIEVGYRRRDGRVVEMSLTVSPIRDAEGRVAGASGSVRDVTEQKRAEAERRKLATIVESATDAIWSRDLDNRITSWNPGAERLFGYTAAEVMGRPTDFLVPPELAAEVRRFRQRTNSGVSHSNLHTVRLRKDGTRVDVSLTFSPVRDEEGRIVGAALIARDISEEKRVEAERRKLATIVESSSDAIWSRDRDGILTSWNAGAERMLGFTAAEVVGRPNEILIPPELWAEVAARRERTNAGTGYAEHHTLRLHKDGSRVNVSLTVSPIRNEEGEVVGAAMIARDIGEQIRAQAERNWLADVVDSSNDAIFSRTPDGTIVSWNKAAERLFGYSAAEAIGKNFEMLVPPEERSVTHLLRERADRGEPFSDFETARTRKDGTRVDVSLSASPIRDDSGKVVGVSINAHDISERKEAERRLHQLAFYDGRTGLPNRTLFEDRLAQAIAQARRHGRQGAIHYIDLDHFKDVNDTLGHQAGDELLRAVGSRIRAVVRESDTVSRLGGDEFAVIQPQFRSLDQVAVLAEKLLRAMNEPFEWSGRRITVGASIGIATFPFDGETPVHAGDGIGVEILKRADIAMYEAKRTGRSSYRFYEQEMDLRARERMELRQSLHGALARGEIDLFFQPQVELATGEVTGAEALLRWHHPTLGLQAPGSFVPLAEESGQIVGIGEWALKRACVEARRWRDDGGRRLVVAVNVSAVQVQRGDFVDLVGSTLVEAGLDPNGLELELTESALIGESAELIDTLRRVRALGVRVSIDDFGTGYSSFRYLKSLPVDKLKVARLVVAGLLGSAADAAILAAMIGMGRALGVEVVAEGVETGEQRDFLHRHGCTAGQGLYFGEPMGADGFAALVGNRMRLPRPVGPAEIGPTPEPEPPLVTGVGRES